MASSPAGEPRGMATDELVNEPVKAKTQTWAWEGWAMDKWA